MHVIKKRNNKGDTIIIINTTYLIKLLLSVM
jgi:hypothetical protein